MPNNTEQTMTFLKRAHNGPPVYRALCLRLAREARGIASLYPSAIAAQHATPNNRRVDWRDVRKGHIAYFDDPSDSNTFGHIATCAGKTNSGRRLWWTNDAKRSGGVDLVVDPSSGTSWFGAHWGDQFVFASDWVNGVRFEVGKDGKPGGDGPKPPKQLDPGLQADEIKRGLRSLNEARDSYAENDRHKRVKVIEHAIHIIRARFDLS